MIAKCAPTVVALGFAVLGTMYCGSPDAPANANGAPDAAKSGDAPSSGATGSSGAASSGSGGSSGGASSSGGGSSSSSGGGSSTGSSGGSSSSGSGNDPTTCAQATRIVAQYKGQWKAAPTQVDTTGQTDAPLLGNGDVGVAVLGTIDSMTFALGKNEFWTLASGAGQVTPMARETLRIPDMNGASYATSQDLASAEVDGTFTKGDTLATRSWVQGDDSTHNLFVTEITNMGSSAHSASIALAPGLSNSHPSTVGSTDNVLTIDVRADDTAQVDGVDTYQVRIAVAVIGAASSISNNTLSLSLAPGATTTIVSSVMSNHDDPNYQTAAVGAVQALTQSDVDTLYANHKAWWGSFWCHSFVEIPDKNVEAFWYGSLYLMASTSRSGEAAPGLWGNWVIDKPRWYGDYHLNYNYEVPFLFTVPVNHPELMDNYDKPIVDWMAHGQGNATAAGYEGLYYEGPIGPPPNGSTESAATWSQCCSTYGTDGAFMGQKSDAMRAAVPMIVKYYYLRDKSYANTIYPFLKGVAAFWQGYLMFDGTRYVIADDSQEEIEIWPQTNGVMSLATLRLVLQGTIDVASALGQDATLVPTWQDILAKLSQPATEQKNGQTIFRETETGCPECGSTQKGCTHSDRGTCIEEIYPAAQIGMASDPKTLATALNTVTYYALWSDCNGTNRFYPAAARVGYDPAALLSEMDAMIAAGKSNYTLQYNCGGTENFNTIPATVSEMLLQSFQGTVRLFSDWPRGNKAHFGDHVAYGGFLFSAGTDGMTVQYVRIGSPLGGTVSLANPWGSPPAMFRNGSPDPDATGDPLVIATSPGDTLLLGPPGSTLTQLQTAIAAPL